jgi:hypothetical protein
MVWATTTERQIRQEQAATTTSRSPAPRPALRRAFLAAPIFADARLGIIGLPRKPRKSASSRLVLVPDVKLQWPEPPPKLLAEEASIWRSIVERMRPGWFYSSEFALESYCRLVADERRLGGYLAEAEGGGAHMVRFDAP